MDPSLIQLERAQRLAHDGDTASASRHAVTTLERVSHEQRVGLITARAREIYTALPSAERSLPAAREVLDLLSLSESTREE